MKSTDAASPRRVYARPSLSELGKLVEMTQRISMAVDPEGTSNSATKRR